MTNQRMHTPARMTHLATQSAFTLIELLVVIAIIALLIAILLPRYNDAQKRPYDVSALVCGRAVVNAEMTAKISTGSYVSDTTQLGTDTKEACADKGVRIVRDVDAANMGAATTTVGIGMPSTGPYIAFKVFHPSGSGYYYYTNALNTPQDYKLAKLFDWN